ncbi:hypothetical protein Tco_0896939, partial [Tanacetum coccineum]
LMAQLKYCDKHNQVGFLRKPDESAGFAEIVDFLRGSNLRYALTSNPTIYDSLVKQFWQTATTNTIADGTLEIHATIDTIGYTITEASIRDTLQLADATGITMLPNDEIFEGMGQMGYPTDGTFTFWKSFFTPQWRYLVHHLLHCISSKSGGWDQFGSNIATALICLSTDRVYNFSKLIFDGMVANLKSKTKFLMYPRFLQLILDIQTENKHPYLAVTLTKKIFGNMKRGFRGAPRPLLPAMLLVATTNPNAGQEHHAVTQTQPSSSTLPVPSTSSPPVQSPPPIPASIPTPTPIPETEPEPFEHTFEEPSPVHQHFSPPQEQAQGQMTLGNGLKNQADMGNAIVKLVAKKTLKRKNRGSGEESEGLIPLRFLQYKDWFTPHTTKVNTSVEGTSEEIRKEIQEKEKRIREEGFVSSLDFQEEVDAVLVLKVSTVVNKESTIFLKIKDKEEGKATNALIKDLRGKEVLNEATEEKKSSSKLQGEDFAKKMVDLVNQRKKYFAEERAKAKRNKPMTQSQLKTYMMNYLTELRAWTVSSLKK